MSDETSTMPELRRAPSAVFEDFTGFIFGRRHALRVIGVYTSVFLYQYQRYLASGTE